MLGTRVREGAAIRIPDSIRSGDPEAGCPDGRVPASALLLGGPAASCRMPQGIGG